MNRTELADLRRQFSSESLNESDVDPDPIAQFARWMEEAIDAKIPDANAMTLATVGENGGPDARVVLLKYYGPEGFAFFTNYESKKGRDLAANRHAVLHFFWPQLDRQIGIYGSVEKTSREDSEKYFALRPVPSRIAAWASNQSSTIESRAFLEKHFEEFREKFCGPSSSSGGTDESFDVPCPPNWGGFRLMPARFEFWQGRQNRLHDRLCYTFENGTWHITRLAP